MGQAKAGAVGDGDPGLRIHTPPTSSHGSSAFGGNPGSGDGTSGSPLRVGRDGAGGETLPVMGGTDD